MKIAAAACYRGEMRQLPIRRPGMHALAADASYRARDCVCKLGARSPASEGQFERAQICIMLGGAFRARSSAGDSLLGAGAILLGNAATPYEFRHVDDGGDRSLVFDYAPSLIDAIGGALELRGALRFRAPAIPASPATAEAVVVAEQALHSGDAELLREAALAVAMIAMAAERDRVASPPFAHAQRAARALRHVEAHFADDCSLERLSEVAGLSRYHFLRVFRAMTGQTPRQHVIATRLRAAAVALRVGRAPVTRVAVDAGFGDLSHFATSFTRAFGVSPRGYRARSRASSNFPKVFSRRAG